MVPVTSFWLVFVLILLSGAQGDDVVAVGTVSSSPAAISKLPPIVTGKSVLLHEINATGLLFAVSSYFVAATNTSFQVWRPQGGTDETGFRRFKLIWQMTATPSVVNFREDIYMEAKFMTSCALVRPGDWFGTVSLTSPSAIGVEFLTTDVPKLPRTGDSETSGANQVVGMQASFEMTTPYPYRFLTAAYLLTDLTSVANVNLSTVERVSCPTRLLVPSWVSAIPMVTYPPGATGATGATGARGNNGTIGIVGPKGQLGLTGPPGSVGLAGSTGGTGPIGSTGSMGASGPQGQRGSLGPPGSRGIVDGDTGATGPSGLPGNDTYFHVNQPHSLMSQGSTDPALMSDGGFADRPELRMGAIIWLALLSALVVLTAVLLCCVCYFVADDRRVQKNETSWIETESKRQI